MLLQFAYKEADCKYTVEVRVKTGKKTWGEVVGQRCSIGITHVLVPAYVRLFIKTNQGPYTIRDLDWIYHVVLHEMIHVRDMQHYKPFTAYNRPHKERPHEIRAEADYHEISQKRTPKNEEKLNRLLLAVFYHREAA